MDLTIKDQDGFTAAELAEYNGHSQCAKYLRTVENMVLLIDGSGLQSCAVSMCVFVNICIYISILQIN